MLAGALLLAACVGDIGDAGGGANGGSDPADAPPPGFSPGPAPMRRLTPIEYVNSVVALTGQTPPTALEGIDSETYGYTTVGAGFASISEQGITDLNTNAQTVAHGALATPDAATKFVGCTPTSATDPCIQKFVSRFGRLAWRRALTPDELTRYVGLVTTNAPLLGNVTAGIESAVAAFLSSPNFLYRVEVGEPDPATGFSRFTGYELASRLSFLLLGSTPDDALLTAAESGKLATVDDIETQTTRLLADARSHKAVLEFFAEHFGLDGLDGLTKDKTSYPAASATIGTAMRGEIEHTLEDLVFTRDTDFRELFVGRSTFVNPELAALYGLPAPSGTDFAPTTWTTEGDRAGLMGFAGILALDAHAVLTSPTERGKLVRERLLCTPIAPPPNNANVAAVTDPAATSQPLTMRDRMTQHATSGQCKGCHTLMDPIGFGLEHFDALGAYRKDDHGAALNTATDLDGKPFDGPAQLGALLHDDPRVTTCLVSKFYAYAIGHEATQGEQTVLADLGTKFQTSGFRLSQLVSETVKSAGFRYAIKPQ